jgi:hypothetical protein
MDKHEAIIQALLAIPAARNRLGSLLSALGADLSIAFLAALDAAGYAVLPKAHVEKMREALEDFREWPNAYPTAVFPEIDTLKAHALLQAGGMTLDAVSATAIRWTLGEIERRAAAVLKEIYDVA